MLAPFPLEKLPTHDLSGSVPDTQGGGHGITAETPVSSPLHHSCGEASPSKRLAPVRLGAHSKTKRLHDHRILEPLCFCVS